MRNLLMGNVPVPLEIWRAQWIAIALADDQQVVPTDARLRAEGRDALLRVR